MQHAQQLGLHGQRQLTHFIQEQGAAIGQFELAPALVQRAGKGAAHMPEQFAFDQGLGQGGAVEADQRFVGARRGGVDRLGHQLLADPGFAGDQHGQVAAADQLDFLDQALVRFALADHFLVLLAAGLAIDLGALVLVFGPQRQALDALSHVDGGCGKAGEGLQGVQFDPFKPLGIEGVQGQQAPGLVVDKQRAAHAVVDFQVAVQAGDQAVIRVGQFAVTVEAGRAGAAQQDLEARMFADLEASAQGIGAQAVHRQRHQPLAIQA